MSFHGTNLPRQESFFQQDPTATHFSGLNSDVEPAANDATGRPLSIGLVSHLHSGARPDGDSLPIGGLPTFWADDMPVEPASSKSRAAAAVAKRTMDILLSGAALLLLLPLMMFVALAIKLGAPGPSLFRQQRLGLNGKPFSIYKFRSMYVDRCSHDGVEQTVAGDIRVMPIGAFLRRTSIDELPQLINVLRGDMSLVGPRPHVEGQLAAGVPYNQVVPYYSYRLKMRPGLTGWAQANGLRGPTDNAARARARVDHDVAYIQNFSLRLDFIIMLKTLYREFFTGSGF